MFRLLLLTAFLPALVFGQATTVRTDGRPAPMEVRVQNCTAAPCDIFQGFDAIMQIDFRAPALANTLRPVVMATALGVTIEYPLDPSFNNACNHLIGGSSCPLAAAEDATYNFVFGVDTYYPPIAVAVELSLIDHAGSHVFCTVIDIHVRIS